MKWFKHETTALHDAKIEKLIMKYGIEGYGVYFACIEMIAHDISKHNLTFELEHDAELLAHKFKIDTIKLEDIMLYCIQLGLFGQSEVNGRITCLKLAKRIDDSQVKNNHMKEIQTGVRSNQKNSVNFSENHSENRIEENRRDKNRIEENINILKLFSEWCEIGLSKHKEETVIDNITKKHIDKFNKFTFDDWLFMINVYKKIKDDDSYYFSHTYTFWDFISRGYKNFLRETNPIDNFKKNEKRSFREKRDNAFIDSLPEDEKAEYIKMRSLQGGLIDEL